MNIESLLKQWGGETVIVRHDKPTGAWIFIAIHSTRLGPALGGTRMKTYPSPEDALCDAMRLAEGMTYKFAVPGLPRGGGKAVIALPVDFDPQSRVALLHRYGTLIQQLNGLFYTGPDVGTSSDDMDIIAETAAPYVFACTPAAGGTGDSGPITALGVFTSIQVVCEQLYGQPVVQGKRVLVQGAGHVGSKVIDYLLVAGAEVLFSDVDQRAIHHLRDELKVPFIPPETVYETECDIFSPCALGGILNATTIPQLRCRAVAGAANNQLGELEDANRLRTRGILYAPDYVVNMGGALAVPGMEVLGWSYSQAETEVIENIQRALSQIFNMSATNDITSDAAARRIAEERLQDTIALSPIEA